ncbi:MAG TPA: hypothetical protein VML75_13195 [Kofleriaceae bacterium]|nr:hypothetical protein [Kofleriaceae bacterium]
MPRAMTYLAVVLALILGGHAGSAAAAAADPHDECEPVPGMRVSPPVVKRLQGADLAARMRASVPQPYALHRVGFVLSRPDRWQTSAMPAFATGDRGRRPQPAHLGRDPPRTRST